MWRKSRIYRTEKNHQRNSSKENKMDTINWQWKEKIKTWDLVVDLSYPCTWGSRHKSRGAGSIEKKKNDQEIVQIQHNLKSIQKFKKTSYT